ncbi:helicase-related protein, partial [Mariniblastus sp.]|nr:helicase-related protein [Mariniblastus sp.]
PKLKAAGIRVGNYTGRYDPSAAGGGADSGTLLMGEDYGISNHNMQLDNPPDVLLTNYKMLDYLLMRPQDQKLWRFNKPGVLQYLVLDELHTYDGAQGADVACLIRRLKERLAIPKGDLCVVGTSATLDDRESNRDSKSSVEGEQTVAVDAKQTGSDRLADFASTLFEEDIDAESVIGEDRLTVEEIIALDVEETELPQPDKCEPEKDEDAVLYALRQSGLWGGPVFQGPKFPSHFFSKKESELTDEDYLTIQAIEDWSVELGSWLKKQELFQHLLKIFEKADNANDSLTWLELVKQLSIQEFGLSKYPLASDRSAISASFFALVAQAKEIRSNTAFPLVPTQIQLWIRELRRLGRTVHEKPNFTWLDEPTQGFPSLPTFHCSDCGESGWIGLRDPESDNEIGANGVEGFMLIDDASQIYRAWFGYKGSRSPNIVIISPQKTVAGQQAGGDEPLRWDDQSTFEFGEARDGQLTLKANTPVQSELAYQQWYFCSKKLVLRMGDGPCPLTHDPARFPVKINNDTQATDNRGVQGIQKCPNCGSGDTVMFIGSQAATLSSVAIDELFGSVMNNDPKLLAFTDSVQDASHRAGFFSARTYNFTFRTALQHIIDEAGPGGIPLDDAGMLLLDGWSQPRPGWPGHIREAMASLMPPDLHDYQDFLNFRNSTKHDKPTDSLRGDINRRLTWQATSEFGVRLQRGRTLESTGSSCLAWDEDRINNTVDGLLKKLPGIDSALTDLTDANLRLWVYGFLHRARMAGALDHNYLDKLASEGWWGKYPFGNTVQGRETYPSGNRAYEPKLMVTKSKGRNEYVLAPSRGNKVPWQLVWAKRALKKPNADDTSLLDLIQALLNVGQNCGLLTLLHEGADRRFYAASSQAARLIAGGVYFTCSESGRALVRPESEAAIWDGSPSLEYYAKSGAYVRRPFTPRQQYYQDRYRKGALRRVMAAEHTGLLETEARETLEKDFSDSKHTDDPNVLTCTSTLEMGIDIGDLSSTMLCSIPPSTASYLQRIGRAGRSTGTALIVSIVNQRPHDLFFYGRPSEMLRGKVDPPGCWLDASAVLIRQYFAFCLDSSTKEKKLTQFPRSATDLVDDLGKEEGQMRSAFAWIGLNEQGLKVDFLNRFTGKIEEDTRQRFTKESRAEVLLSRVEAAASEHDRMMRDLRNATSRLNKQLKALNEEEDEARREIEQEKWILAGRMQNLRRTTALEILTDHGLLPNYAFPERGVRFYGAVYNKHRRKDDSQFAVEVTRPAGVALKELAPSNHFYTHSRKFEVQQIAVGSQQEPLIEKWAICGKCGHMRRIEEFQQEGANPACPQCGHDGDSDAAGDQGQQRDFIEFSRSQALSYMEHYDSLSGDTKDERERVHYQTIKSFDLTGEKPSGAVGDAELPFGIEYRSSVIMREINVGYQGLQGLVAFGVDQDAPDEGFQVCKDCGVVVPASGQINDAKHRRSCTRRRANDKRKQENKDLLPYNWAPVYLHRELKSEAIRLLLPVASEEEIETLSACIHLGLRLRFEGNPAHLVVSPQTMPDSFSNMNRYYLVLLDAVPGGTGYLKTLFQQKDEHGRAGEGLMEVLRLAKDALETCHCRRVKHTASQPDTDGCYRCIRTYRMQYSAASISRENGIELLERLIASGENRLPQQKLSNLRENSLFESMLEKKLVDELKKFVDSSGGKWEKTIVRGSQGFRFSLPKADYLWELQFQPKLGTAQGVGIECRPDFLLSCDNTSVKPIAVFTDGFEFHCDPVNRIADDLRKRRSILDSGNYHVWNVTWKDLIQNNADHNMICYAPVATKFMDCARTFRSQGKDVPTAERIVKNGFEQLLGFIETPHAAGWSQMASSPNVYYLIKLASKRKVHLEELESSLQEWRTTGGMAQLQHREEGIWVHNEKASLTSDVIAYMKVEDAHMNRLDNAIIVARLGDSESEITGSDYEERWRRFLACMNLYQFLDNFHFWAASEVVDGTAPDLAFEITEPVAKEWHEIREEVTSSLRSLVDELANAGLPLPKSLPMVEHYNDSIDDDAFAEMAWPTLSPPVAVLAGDQEAFAPRWQEQGWKVFTPDSLQANGAAALIERLDN